MRYHKTFDLMWNDEKFCQLSDHGKLLFIYLLSCPHSNALGAYILKPKYIEADLNWTEKKVLESTTEVLGKGLIRYDKDTSLVLICNYLKYNPPVSPNHFVNIANIFYSLPKSKLLQGLNNILERYAQDLGKPFVRATEDLGKPEAFTEEVTEEKEKKKDVHESNDSSRSLRAWFDEVMWPSVPSQKKRAKEPTWEEVKKLKPDQETRKRIVAYFSTYYEVKATYDGVQGQFFPEMQDPVRVIKHKRFEDELIPCTVKANGEFAGRTYTDKDAYERAKERGEKNIRYVKPREHYV